ncbi:MAG: aminoglycoside phosphotransferase family protein [Pseudomonadota bacterium]
MNELESNIINIYGDRGKVWLDDLPEIIRKLEVKWDLSDLTPVQNLSFNYVLTGFQNEKPIVLKVGLDENTLMREAAALTVLKNTGAVQILAQDKGVILLERVVPGTSLKGFFPDNDTQAIRIVCGVMRRLHQASVTPVHNFPHIRDWLLVLDKNWDMPTHYLEKARKLRDRLLQTSAEPVLLHGDLHHDNILRQGKTDWVVIDPKGVIGYPLNEIWAFIMDIERDTKFVADCFSFDVQEVRDCYFVHVVMAACWTLEDNGEPGLFIALAEKAHQLLSK